MSKSQVRTLMYVLFMAILCTIIAGCEEQATCEKSPAAVDKPAELAKPAAEKPKEAVKPADKASTLGPYDLTVNWMDEPGFISQWLIVGTFPNPGERPDNNGYNIDYLKNYGGEQKFVPTNGMVIKKDDGSEVKWQQYQVTASDISMFDIEFLGLEPQQEDILCYCACWLDSDADKDVELRVGSDDGYKLWLNHNLVGEQNVYRAMEMDQETYKVKLNKGKNLILFKLTQDWGDYGFTIRIVNSEGKEVPGIKVWN